MRTLCAVFAHPDDESFSAGGTLARYADHGVELTLLTATRGEAGTVGDAAVAPQDLAALREGELRAAAAVLGIRHVRVLGFPDGALSEHHEDIILALREALREVRPQVVLTGDVQGITGHPDHIAVTQAVVRACQELGAAAPLKLYEHVLPQSSAPPGLHATPDDYITTTLDVEPWRERLLAALRMHRSQVSEELLTRFRGVPAPWREHYVCVYTRVPIQIPESDLFTGVPGDNAP